MKRKTVLITLIICAIIISSIILVFVINNRKIEKKVEITKQTQQVNSGGYILKEYNGKIATFRTNSEEPIEIFDVYVSTLPDSEFKCLQKGLYAKDEFELQELIEAYTS